MDVAQSFLKHDGSTSPVKGSYTRKAMAIIILSRLQVQSCWRIILSGFIWARLASPGHVWDRPHLKTLSSRSRPPEPRSFRNRYFCQSAGPSERNPGRRLVGPGRQSRGWPGADRAKAVRIPEVLHMLAFQSFLNTVSAGGPAARSAPRPSGARTRSN